jgi:hypothetical protein
MCANSVSFLATIFRKGKTYFVYMISEGFRLKNIFALEIYHSAAKNYFNFSRTEDGDV